MDQLCSQLAENASPKFVQALVLLLQAHLDDLASQPDLAAQKQIVLNSVPIVTAEVFQELAKEKSPDWPASVPKAETNATDAKERPSSRSKEASADAGNPGAAGTSALAVPDVPDGRKVKKGFCRRQADKVVRWFKAHRAHGHSDEVALFGNMKAKLQEKDRDVDEFPYDVTEFYHTEGCAQSTARADWFGHLSLFFISANAVYIGVDSDLNDADSLNEADMVFIISENIFCVFFTIEVLVRLMAFRVKWHCLKDMWFKFDATLVVIMVVETWVMPSIVFLSGEPSSLPTGPIKLIRLLRLARMVRIMRAFPEIMTMVKGMIVATQPVASSMSMLVGIIYIFAITMHMLVKGDDEVFEYWGTVSRCMMTLLANGTLGDSIGTVMRGVARNVPALTTFILFVILSAVTVTNMLIGVLCEVVSHVAEAEKEHAVLSKLKATLLVMLKELDEDGSGDISKQELHGILKCQDALDVLDELEINVNYFVDTLDMHYEETETCTIAEIMQLLIDNQGGREPKLKDLVNLHTFSRWTVKTEIRKAVAQLEGMKSDSAQNMLLEGMRSNSAQYSLPQSALSQGVPQSGASLVNGIPSGLPHDSFFV